MSFGGIHQDAPSRLLSPVEMVKQQALVAGAGHLRPQQLLVEVKLDGPADERVARTDCAKWAECIQVQFGI